ncbi:MAG: ABC transporter permease [Gemmatimonadota bacterium]|nr:ABC transporter permease [Gemmatimonadota bacterium]
MSFFAIITQVLRIAVPYLFAAAGGVIAERSGIISLTLEGYMLGGAFSAVVGTFYFGSPAAGVLCGIAGGALLALIHAVASIRYRADQVIVGIAINLFAVGITRFFLKLLFGSSSNSPRVVGFAAGYGDPIFWLGLLVTPIAAFLLFQTAFGLRVRATGEKPEAAASVGVPVRRVQYTAVLLSGALAALGGVYLALDQHQFTDQMTAGRGFIAVAAVIFGRWSPLRAGAACLLFAAAETVQIQLQGNHLVASQFIEMIPYVLTIVALAGVVGRAIAPAALGRAEA